MKTVLIIGSEGQDGTLLTDFLLKKGYGVYGLGRSDSKGLISKKYYLQFDLALGHYDVVSNFVKDFNLDEIYYLAAFHHSSQEINTVDQMQLIEQSVNVNQLGFIKILEIVNQHARHVKVFYASSSLIFSGGNELTQNEETITAPRCIYSVTKCAAMEAAKYYRSQGIFVSIGILYNHESILRKDGFLSKKIINETQELLSGKRSSIIVGDLSSTTDWGYAPDFVIAMWHILQLNQPDVFIVSSGKPHTVQNWFEVLFQYLNKNWREFVKEDQKLLIRKKPTLIGDNRKLRSTGWDTSVSFEEMVIKMYNNIL